MTNNIDLIILIFLGIHAIRGYINGFSKTLFLSVRFLGTLGVTYYVYQKYSQNILAHSAYRIYGDLVGELVQKFMNPFLYAALDMDKIILMITLFVVSGILIQVFFGLLSASMNKGTSKALDKNLGFLLGGFKGVLYVMVFIAIVNPWIQRLGSLAFKDQLSQLTLLKYFYSYNIFLNYFAG